MGVIKIIRQWRKELKIAMLLTGSSNVNEIMRKGVLEYIGNRCV